MKAKKMAAGGVAGKPATTGLSRAAEMSGRTMPTKPMKKGGSVDGIAKKGHTKGKMVTMKKGGKAC